MTGVVEICSLLDATLDGMTDIVEVALLADVKMIIVMDDTECSSLLDDTPLSVIEDVIVMFDANTADDSLLLDSELVLLTDGMEVTSMLEMVLTEVVDDALLETELLNITLVEITDDVDANFLLDDELVGFTDNMEVPSLLEMILTEVIDKRLPETDSDDAEVCSLTVTIGVVEYISLVDALLVEVIVCTEVNIMFDAAVVEITDAADVISLFGIVLVAVVNCTVKSRSLVDMILTLLMDDVDINILSATEALAVINCREVCLLLGVVVLVGTTDVELSSLFDTLIAEVTVCAEFSSLLDIMLLDVPDNEKIGVVVPDNLLVIDGTDICSVLIEAIDDE